MCLCRRHQRGRCSKNDCFASRKLAHGKAPLVDGLRLVILGFGFRSVGLGDGLILRSSSTGAGPSSIHAAKRGPLSTAPMVVFRGTGSSAKVAGSSFST